MPLVIVSGFPCAGKTTRSKQIIADFASRIETSTDPRTTKLKLQHINDESLGVSRDVYHTARAEKDARAEEMSAVKRHLDKDTIVVADGLNYIKGFRYQLFCEAKAMQTPCCVIHIGTNPETCRLNHAEVLTRNIPTYSADDFENLIFRYEEPNGMSRWDSPLFIVIPDDEHPPYDAIWTAIIGEAKDAYGQPKVVRPNAATVLKPASAADYLYELDKATTEIVGVIAAWQADHVGEEGGEVPIPGLYDSHDDGGDEDEDESTGGRRGRRMTVVRMPNQAVSLPQLQRVRRQFIALNRQHTLDKARIRPSFVDYLNDTFGQ